MKNSGTDKVRRLVESAILIAIGTVLSVLTPIQLPFGGSLTIASMLPLILIAYRYGTRWGLFSGFVYSLLQMLIGLKTVSAFFMPGDGQMLWYKALMVCLLDYVLAYTVLGLGGIFRGKKRAPVALCLGAIVAISLRYAAHIVSGAIFFGTWAEWFFTDVLSGAFGNYMLFHFSGFGLATIYSVIYNGAYMVPEIIITAIAAVVVGNIPAIAGPKHQGQN